MRFSIFSFLLALVLAVGICPQDTAAQVGGSPLKVITNVPVGHCFASAGPTSATDGGVCGSASTGLSGMSANQIPIANSATTIGSSFSLGTGVQAFLGAATSANLAAALTDETGTGLAVFGTSPTITTPILAGLSSGTCVNGIALDSGNHVVTTGCSAGSGLSGMTSTQIPIAGSASTITSSQTISQILDGIGSTQGGVLYRGASSWSYLAPGTNGFFLETQGASANPVWAAATGTNGMSGLTTGQVPLAGSSNTLTSSFALGTGVQTFLTTPTSANLASALTNETGSGLAVFGTSPSLTTPAIAGATLSGTLAGTPTYSGVPIYSGLSAGTVVSGGWLGLDSGNHLVTATSAGGAALTTTDATHNVANTTQQTFNGNCFVVGGSAGLATIDPTQTVNDQTGGDYSVALADSCKIIEGGVHTYTYALGTLGAGFATMVQNVGTSGNMTMSATGGNFTGLGVADASTFTLGPGESAYISSIAGPKGLIQKSVVTGTSSGVASVASGSSDIAVAGTGSGPFTGAVTVSRSVTERTQAGGSIVAADGGKIVYNTGGTGITLPVHTTTGFGAGFATTVLTDGTPATLTVTTDTLNGNSTLPLGIKQGVGIVGDGTNLYKGLLGMPEVVASGVLVSSAGRVAGWQAGTTSQLVRGDGSLGTLGTAASAATGTSGATIPLLNGNWTESGNVTFSGTILASGLSSGTCTNGLSVDSGNNVVKTTCSGGDVTQAGNNTFTGINVFGETHSTTYAPTLTSNNYTVLTSDCGKILLLPTGTTPTLTLPNINPTGGCVIRAIETTSDQYTPGAAAGGTLTANINGFTKTKGVGAFVVFVLTTPSVSAATWMWSGDGA